MRDASEPALECHDERLGARASRDGSRVMSFAGLLLLLMVCACGRTEHSAKATPNVPSSSAPVEGGVPQASAASSDTSSPGTGPIDASGQPVELTACPDRSPPLVIELPCVVGQNVASNGDQPDHNLVECRLSGTPNHDALYFMLPLAQLPELLDEPVRLPLEPTVSAPGGPDVPIGGEHLVGTLAGLITFTQVDVDGRAFVAMLEQGQIEWGGDPKADFNCSTMDGPV